MNLQTLEEAQVLETQIFNAPVPVQTESYTPVSHANIVNAIQEEADKRGMVIRNKQYWTNRKDQQITGKFNIVVPGDDEMGMMVAFRNSYDRTMSLGFAAGGNVWICTNGMVSGDITLVRRHTGSIVSEITEKINVSMDQLEDQFSQLVIAKEKMKQVEVSKTLMAEMAGRMFIQDELINSTQLNIVKQEILTSENFGEENLWSMYNHVTEAYKKSSAYSYIDNHRELHQHFAEQYELV